MSLPGLLKLAHLVETDFFGRILSVRGEFGYWVFTGDGEPAQRPSWNYRKADGGGIILDMLCHWRYVLENIFGPVRSVSCLGATHNPNRWDENGNFYDADADDAAYATFELDGGIVAQINSSWCTRVNRKDLVTFQVDGTNGSAVAGLHYCVSQSMSNTPRPVWNPDEALTMIAENECVFTAAATPFLKDLVDADWKGEQAKLSSMLWFLCGGAQVPPALMEKAKQEFPHTFVTLLWGMTEGGLTTATRESPAEKTLTTAGIGLPGLEMRILDPEGKSIETGIIGELAMRGPGVFIGYYGQDDLYKSLLTADGFFRTGDLATLDETGHLRITGRLKDFIISGGVNISPVPIEDALSSHSQVSGVAVIGFPDERMGELLCAVIIPKDEIPTLKNLNNFLREKGLPKYHCPELLRIVEKFPTTPAGKIRKAELQKQIVAEVTMQNKAA